MMNMAYAKHWCAIISTMDVDLVKEEGSASNMLPAANVQTMSAGSGNAMLPHPGFQYTGAVCSDGKVAVF